MFYHEFIDFFTGPETSPSHINGVEALLRWNHPERGMIPPSIFIPLAEKSSLINTIGKWVLATACAQNKKWQDMSFKPMPAEEIEKFL